MYTNPMSASTTATSASAQSGSNSSGMDSMFMQLLITQLQNQDPLSPMDPSTFVSQLVEVNNLDQVTQIHQLLQGVLGYTSTTYQTSAGGQ
jgi:flagellar basal-body rod modification protein FlgD